MIPRNYSARFAIRVGHQKQHQPLLLLLALLILPLHSSIADVSADTATLLCRRVLIYNVFVNDRGAVQWSSADTADAMHAVRQACGALQSLAPPAMPLSFVTEHVTGSTIIDINPANGLTGSPDWACKALSDLHASIGKDCATAFQEDGTFTDDAVLWLQDVWSHDPSQGQCIPTSVVLAFHIHHGPACSAAATGEVDQENAGPMVAFFGGVLDWKAYAHEFLHEFGSCDEYATLCTCVCDNAFVRFDYGTISQNGETNPNCDACLLHGSLDCIMQSCAPHGLLCDYTRRQIGWGDSDGDGRPDAIDPDPDRLVISQTSVHDFERWEPHGQFYVIDVAGGEMQSVRIAAGLGTPATADSFPLPLRGKSDLVWSNGYLFFRSDYYYQGSQIVGCPTIYSRRCRGGELAGEWQVAGIGPGGGIWALADMVASNGYIYAVGTWETSSQSDLRYARVNDDGTLGTWTPIQIPWTENNYGARLATANGFLYVEWDVWPGYYQPVYYYVRGAALRADGSIGLWDTTDVAGTGSSTGNMKDLAATEDCLYLICGNVSTSWYDSNTWYAPLRSDGGRVGWTRGPNMPNGQFRATAATAAGCLFAVGGIVAGSPGYDISTIVMSRIQPGGALGPWSPAGDLPLAAGFPGVAFVSESDLLYMWAGGGRVSDGCCVHNDLHVLPVDSSDEYPARARASCRVNLGSQKRIRSIAWRSRHPEADSLSYRVSDESTQYGPWSDPVPQVNGRVVFPDPGMPARTIDLAVIAAGSDRIHDIVLTYSDPTPGATPVGDEVLVTLPETAGQIRFDRVTDPGVTTALSVANPPAAPPGKAIRSVFDIETTAGPQGAFDVGIAYDPDGVGSEAGLRLMHYTGGYWQDITASRDPIARTIWGAASSLSAFAVMEDTTEVASDVETRPPTGAPRTAVIVVSEGSPNPFGLVTSLDLRVVGGGRLTIQVYDSAGRCVRTLLDGVVEAGMHRVTWDGQDDRGALQGSGVYFLTAQMDGARATRKAVVIR